MTARPQVSIRLATDGKAQVQRDLADIGVAGDAAAQRIARSFERDSATAEAALSKLARTQERLQAISQTQLQQTIGRSTSTGFGDPSGTARTSALAMEQQFARGEQAARQLLASVDPLFAAQMRYNQAIEQTNLLEAQGVQIEGGFARVRAGLKSQLDDTTALYGKQGSAIGNTRIAQMELMHVVRGSVDQFAAGAPPMQIFTMHLGMLGQAAALSGESMGKFGAFMSSGWGLALTVAVVALGPLITKLGSAGDEIDGLVEKLKKEAQQQGLNDQAHRVFANTLDGVREALRKNREALDNLAEGEKSAAEKALASAFAAKTRAQGALNETQANLDLARSLYEVQKARASGPGQRGELAALGLPEALGNLDAQQAAITAARAALDDADRQITEATVRVYADAAGKSQVDLIKDRYKTLVDQATRRATQEALAAKASGNQARTQALITTELQKQIVALDRQRDAEVKAVEERNRKPGKNAGGTAIFNDQIANFFDIANKYRGKSEVADKGVLEQFFREANLQLDPEKTAWCAAFVNAVLAAGGARGTGSLAASSFLGFGKDDTSSPQKGDIVIVRSGGSPSGMHVGFLDSIDAKGNVSLLGGNTGNRVGESTFGASQVLGVRRPPTPAEAFSDEAKTAQEEQDRLHKLLNTEQEVAVVKGSQVEFAQELLHANLSLEDQIKTGIIPALKDWDKQYKLITESIAEAKQFGAQLIDDLLDPAGWTNWRDMAMRVLKDVESELMKLALINPLKNALDGGTRGTISALFQGIGSIAGALVGGGIRGPDLNSPSAVSLPTATPLTSMPGGFATGTEYAPGGLAWVGEHGRELVRLPRGSKITPAAESRRLAAANDGGIGSININIPIDATGADAAELARLRGELQQLRADLPGHVVSAYYEAKQRFVIQ